MERESFEDEEIAELLNSRFVPVKIDREERPDIDSTYMTFLQATEGHGGWPMSVWLAPAPSLAPLYAGTYYPRPAFAQLLARIAQLWAVPATRERIVSQGGRIMQQLRQAVEGPPGGGGAAAASQGASGEAAEAEMGLGWLNAAAGEAAASTFAALAERFDPRYGGFSTKGPKFPRPTELAFLAAFSRRQATLQAAAAAQAMAKRYIDPNASVLQPDHLKLVGFALQEGWLHGVHTRDDHAANGEQAAVSRSHAKGN
jgi:uncharacterized protein YyaL (SSP411 family)